MAIESSAALPSLGRHSQGTSRPRAGEEAEGAVGLHDAHTVREAYWIIEATVREEKSIRVRIEVIYQVSISHVQDG
jgi:hypothetical protein